MSKNIFIELKASYNFLSRVERIIADLILDRPQQFVSLTMGELSSLAGVSQGSINNFAKKFSPGGFSALKLMVASSLSSYEEAPVKNMEIQNVKDAMSRVMDRSFSSFASTLELNDEQVLESTVRRILSARKIAIYGIFHSGIVARDFCYRLIQLGIPATFVEDTLMCAVSAAMLDEKALVIAISSSGRTSDIINAAEIAKKNAVPVVCLTCNRFSPLAKLSDDVLLSTPEFSSSGDSVGLVRMAQLFVIDTLCSYLSGVVELGDRKHRDKLQEILNSHSITD